MTDDYESLRQLSDRATLRFTALASCAVFLALVAPMHLLVLTGAARSLCVGLAIGTAFLAATIWTIASQPSSPAWIDFATNLLVSLPIVNSLTLVAATADIQQSETVMLTLVSIGGVLRKVRPAATFTALTVCAWAGLVVGEDIGHGRAFVQQAFLVLIGAAVGATVFWIRARGEQRLLTAIGEREEKATELAIAHARLSASERRFREVFDTSPVAISLADEDGHFAVVNGSYCKLVGRPEPHLVGRSSREFTHPDDLEAHRDAQQLQQQSPDGIAHLEKRYLRPDGTIVWAQLSATAISGPQGQHWTLVHAQDITARKQFELQLQESEADLAAIATVARCAQTDTDPRGVALEAMCSLSGASTALILESVTPGALTVTAARGMDHVVGVVLDLAEPSVCAHVWRVGEALFLGDVAASPMANQTMLALDSIQSALWQPTVVDGQVVALLAAGWRSPIPSLEHRAVRAVQVVADEIGLALRTSDMQRRREEFARTDPLTGLLNRRAWDEQLRSLLTESHRYGHPLVIAIADLDHFKSYNDTYGHFAGDQFLQQFATAARACLRATDVFARWGGEEFIIALPGCDITHAMSILEKVRTSVPHGRTCSIGATQWDTGETLEACTTRADHWLYEAKHAGRDRVTTDKSPVGCRASYC